MSISNIVLGVTATTILIVPGGANYANVALILCNTSLVSVTVTVYAIPNGSSAVNGTTILKTITIGAEDSFTFDSKLLLGAGDSIVGIASAAASITATVSYLSI